MSTVARVPVLVVGGYLGAGKTTLLNDLLARARALGRRVAVMVNDFGALGIDRDLIDAADDDVVALDGGCVCCTVGADLLGSLAMLTRRAPGIDRIVIEASGVALPGPLAATIDLSIAHRTEAIVVVADAGSLATRLGDRYVGDTISRQLSAADQVILTRTETLDEFARADAARVAAAAAPGAIVHAAPAGSGLRAAWLDTLLADGPEPAPRTNVMGPSLHLGAFARRLVEPDHPVSVFAWWAAAPVDGAAVVAALRRCGGPLLRMKGVLKQPDGKRTVLQGIGKRIDCSPLVTAPARSDEADDAAARSRLVCYVLKNVDTSALDRLSADLAALGLVRVGDQPGAVRTPPQNPVVRGTA